MGHIYALHNMSQMNKFIFYTLYQCAYKVYLCVYFTALPRGSILPACVCNLFLHTGAIHNVGVTGISINTKFVYCTHFNNFDRFFSVFYNCVNASLMYVCLYVLLYVGMLSCFLFWFVYMCLYASSICVLYVLSMPFDRSTTKDKSAFHVY